MKLFKYLFLGLLFGLILYKAEVVSWYRIQEMFRFQSFHMYGVIGSAIAVGLVSLILLRKFKARSAEGEVIATNPKLLHKGVVIGGLLFGMGWALTGACPGPLFVLVGSGHLVVVVPLFFALVGTWVYGRLREKLPH